MSQTHEERVIHLHELYQNGGLCIEAFGVSSYQFHDMSTKFEQPLHHMVDETRIQTSLASWKKYGTGDDVPTTMMVHAKNKLAYLDILEQDMFRIFKEARASLEKQKILIINTIKQKEKKVLDAEKQDVVDRVVEREILHRLNSPSFPLDMVRYIGEFLFKPSMRLQCLMSVQPDIRFLMNTMKAPNVKRLLKIVSRVVSYIWNRIRKHHNLYTSLPKIRNSSPDHTIAFDVFNNPKKYIKQGKCKDHNINVICQVMDHFNVVVNSIRQLGFRRIVQRFSKDMMKMYHVVQYASRPEWNMRKTNRSN